jgi:carboxyl-terminal processing protease
MTRFVALLVFFVPVVAPGNLLAKDGQELPPTTAATRQKESDSYENTLLLTRVIELIREQYVDEKKVSYRALTHAALKGVLSSLDPHSQFLNEDDFGEMRRDTKGEFPGLGLHVGLRDNKIVVIAPMEDTPAHRAGILPGDQILKIDDKTTDKMSLDDAIKLMRGRPGDKITLTILRAGKEKDRESEESEVFERTLVREVIRVATVRETKILPEEIAGKDKIGYIRLEQFGDNTDVEFDNALAKLTADGMESLVLDLRNNPGGLLDSAVEIAGKFLSPGQVIVSTEGRSREQSFEYRARGTKRYPDIPVAVIVNSYSASGAEIVAGALKDLGRAVLIGETTFGKGSVQSVQDLGDGIGLRLTTAKYYTPSKKVIHEVGVEPDIMAPISEVEERALVMSRSPQLLTEKQKRDLRNIRDSQLERAIGALKSIRIFTQRLQQQPQNQAAAPSVKKEAANRAVAPNP